MDTIEVPDITGLKGTDRVLWPCGRCGGTGIYDGPTNARWDNGISGYGAWCFWCGGAKVKSVLVSSIRARERREEKARAEAAESRKRAEEAQAAWEAAGYAALLEQAENVYSGLRAGDPLARDLRYAADALNLYAATEADADKVRAALAEVENRKTSTTPAPEGRIEVEGEVVSIKWKDSDFGGALKVLVQCEGFKVWGTLPKELSEQNYLDENEEWQCKAGAEAGDRVAFTATFARSADDAGFAFFKRPTKARIVAKSTVPSC